MAQAWVCCLSVALVLHAAIICSLLLPLVRVQTDFPAQSLRSLRRAPPSPSTTVSGADGPAHAAFIEPISFFVAEHVLSLAYPCHLSSSSLSRTFVFLLLSPRPFNSFLTSFPHFVSRWSLSIRSHSFLYIWNISTSPRQTRRDPAM